MLAREAPRDVAVSFTTPSASSTLAELPVGVCAWERRSPACRALLLSRGGIHRGGALSCAACRRACQKVDEARTRGHSRRAAGLRVASASPGAFASTRSSRRGCRQAGPEAYRAQFAPTTHEARDLFAPLGHAEYDDDVGRRSGIPR